MAIYKVKYKAYRGGVWDIVEGTKEYESNMPNEKLIVEKILRDVGMEIRCPAWKIKAIKVVKIQQTQNLQLSLLNESEAA